MANFAAEFGNANWAGCWIDEHNSLLHLLDKYIAEGRRERRRAAEDQKLRDAPRTRFAKISGDHFVTV